MIDEVLPTILRDAHSHLSGAFSLRGEVGLSVRIRAMDIFECMICIDNAASRAYLTGCYQRLDGWALSEPGSLAERLRLLPRTWSLATVLTITPRAMGRLCEEFSLYTWMELARASNGVSADQAAELRENRELETFICEDVSVEPPSLNLPTVMALPMPSALRVVQNFRFRKGLRQDSGYQDAMRQYVKFFC